MPRAKNAAGKSIYFLQSQSKLILWQSKWPKEGNKLFFFPCHCPLLVPIHLNAGRHLSVSFTYLSSYWQWSDMPKSPSEPCQIPASYVHFPPSLPISQTTIQKGHFWCADSFPCPIHSRVCPWSLLHSPPRFTNTLAVLGHDQRLFIHGHFGGSIPTTSLSASL